jgi:hypothetical protein
MITGIEILKFGVEDRAASNKFLADFGLSKVLRILKVLIFIKPKMVARFIYLIVMISVCRLLLNRFNFT